MKDNIKKASVSFGKICCTFSILFYFALLTVENNKNKKYVKFQGDMLNFCDFIQIFLFTTNHHLTYTVYILYYIYTLCTH